MTKVEMTKQQAEELKNSGACLVHIYKDHAVLASWSGYQQQVVRIVG